MTRINQWLVAYRWIDGKKLPLTGTYMLYSTDTIMVSTDDGKTFGMLTKDYKYDYIKEFLK